MLRWFEQLINPFDKQSVEQPPSTLIAFYWHYVRQAWPYFAAVLVVGFFAAVLEVALFAFLGQIVDLMREAKSPSSFISEHGATLAWMAFVALIARPAIFTFHTMLVNQTITPPFTSLVRYQSHRYVLRQSLSFFENDFAGRIAQRIMQTAPALRQSVVQMVDSLWFVIIHTVLALVLFFENDPLLMIPLMIWIALFAVVLKIFVPRIKDLSASLAESRSTLAGRIVDSYTNISTVKLFAQAEREDMFAKDAMKDFTGKFHDEVRFITLMECTVWTLNGFLIVSTCGLALWLWSHGAITLGAIALATGLVIRINTMAGWIMFVVTGIFENIGTVQEGVRTISSPIDIADKPGAKALKVTEGEIYFDNIRFHYGKEAGVIENLSLRIEAGEKVGLVGRSGAGKSTLAHLLLRFYDLEAGRILIDGQDISQVTQQSLRTHIGMVSQDTSLLHRSVRENIRYGSSGVSEEDILAAAIQARADVFIPDLVDLIGRTGYDAHVGERGVKLSGGQRQRIAIARVLLKNAPILILDEATSALDSEVEQEIQEQFRNLMTGKTVIAIAHRLSTIAVMDRLVVLDRGKIVEEGSHEELVARKGIYAGLWAHQSGGFLAQDAAE